MGKQSMQDFAAFSEMKTSGISSPLHEVGRVASRSEVV